MVKKKTVRLKPDLRGSHFPELAHHATPLTIRFDTQLPRPVQRRSTRDAKLLELLATRGWDCRVLTCGVLDFQNETPLDDVLSAIDRPSSRVGAALSRGGEAEVFDLELDGVHLTSNVSGTTPNSRSHDTKTKLGLPHGLKHHGLNIERHPRRDDPDWPGI